MLETVTTKRQREVMEHLVGQARDIMARDGVLSPMAFVMAGESMHIVALPNFPSDAAKRIGHEYLKQFARKLDADAVMVLTEVWYVQRTDEEMEERPDQRPTDESDRIEAVAFHLDTRLGHVVGLANTIRGSGAPTFGDVDWNAVEMGACGEGQLFVGLVTSNEARFN